MSTEFNVYENEGEGTEISNEKVQEYLRDLVSERVALNNKYPHTDRLLEQEIQATKSSNKPFRDTRYVDIYREKQIKVTVKVLIPVKEHPKFNFVGKLLGPKGNSMRRLQEETMSKMAILGRGSMKDKKREEELRNSCEPKYAHLNEELHVEVSTMGSPAEAHARIAYALAEIRKYLIPDSNDTIRQEQLREILSGEAGPEAAQKIKEKQKMAPYNKYEEQQYDPHAAAPRYENAHPPVHVHGATPQYHDTRYPRYEPHPAPTNEYYRDGYAGRYQRR